MPIPVIWKDTAVVPELAHLAVPTPRPEHNHRRKGFNTSRSPLPKSWTANIRQPLDDERHDTPDCPLNPKTKQRKERSKSHSHVHGNGHQEEEPGAKGFGLYGDHNDNIASVEQVRKGTTAFPQTPEPIPHNHTTPVVHFREDNDSSPVSISTTDYLNQAYAHSGTGIHDRSDTSSPHVGRAYTASRRVSPALLHTHASTSNQLNIYSDDYQRKTPKIYNAPQYPILNNTRERSSCTPTAHNSSLANLDFGFNDSLGYHDRTQDEHEDNLIDIDQDDNVLDSQTLNPRMRTATLAVVAPIDSLPIRTHSIRRRAGLRSLRSQLSPTFHIHLPTQDTNQDRKVHPTPEPSSPPFPTTPGQKSPEQKSTSTPNLHTTVPTPHKPRLFNSLPIRLHVQCSRHKPITHTKSQQPQQSQHIQQHTTQESQTPALRHSKSLFTERFSLDGPTHFQRQHSTSNPNFPIAAHPPRSHTHRLHTTQHKAYPPIAFPTSPASSAAHSQTLSGSGPSTAGTDPNYGSVGSYRSANAERWDFKSESTERDGNGGGDGRGRDCWKKVVGRVCVVVRTGRGCIIWRKLVEGWGKVVGDGRER